MTLAPDASGGVVIAATSSVFSAIRASPLLTAIKWARASSSTSTRRAATPRSRSASARLTMVPISSSRSGSRRRTRERDTSVELTSKNGFPVVAPMRITVPSST